MSIKLLIFDFWGTLVYFPKTDLRKFYASLGDFGLQVKTAEEIKKFSSSFSRGMSFSQSWLDFSRQVLTDFGQEISPEKTARFAVFLKEKTVFIPYKDVEEILNLPYEKAILTDSARFLVETLKLADFSNIFTPLDTGVFKPDPKAFLAALDKSKRKPAEAVMIGDSLERDILPAKKIGMKTVLIDREDQLKGYQEVKIESLGELKNVLVGL